MFKVTCFLNEDEQVLFPLLLPLHFTWHRDNKLIWSDGKHDFIIEPFSIRGRESQGYRIYFNGTPKAGQYLFERSIGCFLPKISGVEFILSSTKNQSSLIKIAERASFISGSLYGLYEYKGVGIVILPNGEITFQIRNRKIRPSGLASVMKEIESVSSIFQTQEFNLFSFMDNPEEGVFVS